MSLRWILLLLAALAIAGIFYGNYRRRQRCRAPLTQPDYKNHADSPALGDVDTVLLEEEVGTQSEAFVDVEINPVATAHEPQPESKPGTANPSPANRYLAFYVMARQGRSFAGYELLQTLLAAGLQHDNQGTFHCYKSTSQGIASLFQLVQACEPGIINVDDMGGFECSGLCLIMPVQQADPMAAFTKLLTTVQQLADDLDGDIQDQHRQPCQQHYLQQCHQQIMDYLATKQPCAA